MRSRTVIILGLLAATAALPVSAQLKSAEKPLPAKEYAKEAYTIESSSMRVVAESDGTGSRELAVQARMLAEAGVKVFAVLNFTYTSANEVVDIDYVRVRKPDGTVVKTPDYNIQDMPGEVTRSAPLYSDIHEKHVAVKGLGVGDVLEYLVRFRVLKPEVPGHFWFEHYFQTAAIIKDEQLEISVPADKFVKVVSPDFKPEIKDAGGRRIYHWAYSNLAIKEKDPDEIPKRTPPNPSVQVTTFANWDEIGRWYGSLQKDSLEVTPEIQAKAAELTKGLQTDDEKIRALYNFVSLRYHYVGLDFGIGRYQPHAAEDVLENNYGDCKDKHTLLAALLKAAGYEAWPALIHSSRKLDPEAPSPAQFNHVITVVPRGQQMLWLDTTPEVAPYGLLLLQIRDKQALVIPTNRPPLLMTTPANPPFPQLQEFSMQGKLSAEGTFSGHAEQSFRGDVEVPLRGAFRRIPQSQWRDAVQRFSETLNFGGDVSNVTVSAPDELDTPLQISYDYVRKNYADWDNHQIVLPLPPMGVESTKNSKDRKPSEPALLGALGDVNYRSRVELPGGFSMTPPQAVNLVEPYAEYHTTNRLEKGVLTSTRKFKVKKNQVELEQWEQFRKFGREVADDEYNFIKLTGAAVEAKGKAGDESGSSDDNETVDQTLRKGVEALQRRDLSSAQKAFENVIAKDPKNREAHLRLGAALAGQNKNTEATTEFHKAEDLAPNDPKPYLMVANFAILRGRDEEAMEEYRRLLKVNPDNADAAGGAGQLLYKVGKYPEAAEVMEHALKSSPDSLGLQYRLGLTYLKMGDSGKALSHIKTAAEAHGGDPMVLNNIAFELAENKSNLKLAQGYAERAVKQLEQESSNDEDVKATQYVYQLSLVWDTLGWIYFQQGETARAENLVRSSWLLQQDSVVGEHLGEIYEKEGKKTEAGHMYELALAAVDVRLVPTAIGIADHKKQSDGITSRYLKLTGKAPSLRETRRLSNGQWTKSVVEQLTQMRTVKFGAQSLSGSAEFKIVFSPGKVEKAEFVSGQELLKTLSENIKSAQYEVEFPSGSQAKILRRAEVSCFPSSGCMAVLIPTDRAMTVTQAANQN